MVKLVFLCRRRPELTHAQYVAHLLDRHVPLALRHHPTLRRYVVNIVESTRGPVPAFDSIGELWFDTLDDYRIRLYDSPEGERTIVADVASFLAAADAYATVEHVQRAPASQPIGRTPGDKLFACLKRPAAQTKDAFVTHWLTHHAPLALRHHATTRYVTNVVEQRLSRTGADYDGFAELVFPPGEIARGMYLSPEGQREIEADMPRFIGTVHAYVVSEHVACW
ncbi:MAG TPA: EthD domain-containing protein [Candidatus Binatia bacterium]|nr:EthD domain-containing protein [Candidatus Binatia bacterium]